MRIVLPQLLCLFLFFGCTKAQKLEITNDGKTQYKILLSLNADANEIKAANVFQSYVRQVTNVLLPIKKSNLKGQLNAIIITNQKHLNDNKLLTEDLSDDGVAILTNKSNLYLVGGSGKGTIYSAYSFIEKYLNCRMFTPYEKVIPKIPNLSIDNNIRVIEIPKLKHREYWYFGSFLPGEEYLNWHKLDTYTTDLSWGGFMIHTYKTYLPKDLDLTIHPEFTALVNGKRNSDQLDYSNDVLIGKIIAGLKLKMASDPKKVWAINPNDNQNFCDCPKCHKLTADNGTKMAPLMYLINKVAEAFPTKEFTTVAYLDTRKAPSRIRPAKNVKIVLCNLDAVLNSPMSLKGNSLVNDSFRKDLSEWSKLSPNIMIWDYMSMFNQIYIPFPILNNMSEDIKFYAENNVKGMFIESDGGLKSSFSQVKAYLAAKKMWNSNVDENAVIKEFFDWYYGSSSGAMMAYYKLLNDNFKNSGVPINCMTQPSSSWVSEGYFKPTMTAAYRSLLNQALSLSKNDKTIQERIQFEYFCLDYFDVELAKKRGNINAASDLKDKTKKLYEGFIQHNISVSNYFLKPVKLYMNETNEMLKNYGN